LGCFIQLNGISLGQTVCWKNQELRDL